MRPVVFISIAVVAALALSACGKRGELRAPDDATTAYTYPKAYPKPSTVAPAVPVAPKDEEPRARPGLSPAPTGAGRLSVTPNIGRTKTYGTPPQ